MGMEYPLNQSYWGRGWKDTKTAWKSLPFIILDTVVCVVVGARFGWYWGLGLFLFAMLCAWIGATASAPIKQRNEARNRIRELESEKPELFKIDWPGRPMNIFIGKGQDGRWTHREGGVGPSAIKLTSTQDLLEVDRLSLSPSVRFVRSNGYGSTNAIKTNPLPFNVPTMKDTTVGVEWDNTNPLLWELRGLPLKLSKEEILSLPQIMISVEDAGEAGKHFDESEKCLLVFRITIRTDKGSQDISDLSMELKPYESSYWENFLKLGKTNGL